MEVFLRLLVNVLEEGLIYGIMAMGVYITYSVLSFPDLSVDGTFPLGCCVTAVLIANGVNPVCALLIAFLCGCAAGLVTGLLHVKLHITDLLSGILVMTALWSVNLVILGGKAVFPFYNMPTLFNSGLATLLPGALYRRRVLIVLAVVALIAKFAEDWFFRTKAGLLLRAAGNNSQYVTELAIDPGRMKVLGLMLGNGLVALSGSVLAQSAESANVNSGTGMLVMSLAAVVIGLNLFGSLKKWLAPTTMVLLGSIVYKIALVVAMQLGLPTNYMKLLMSLLFVAALISGNAMEGRRSRHAIRGK
ncbi:MAG: ABC transporter permease [Clostridia bacterium]|nr:ABC transporter permease [Clostridia bacterium]